MHALITLVALSSLALAAPSKPCRPGQYQQPSAACSRTCPASFFANTSTGVCTPCFSSTYKTCSSGRSTAATSCISGYLLRSGRCQKRCPPHSLVSTDCYAEQCEAGWVVEGGKCYKQCGDGFYADSTADDATCVPCKDSNALRCTAQGSTLECKPQYYPDNISKLCVPFSTCPAGSYVWALEDAATGCQKCPEGAEECEDLTARATKCSIGYNFFVEAGLCVETCPNTQTRIGCRTFTFDEEYLCLPTYQAGNFCLPCGGNGSLDPRAGDYFSTVCGTNGQAVSCARGYSVVNGRCARTPTA